MQGDARPNAPDFAAGRWLAAALALLVAGSALHAAAGYYSRDLGGHAWGSDDAYISFRYARNLVEGQGLVFNPGERVEGYSNFLYVLLVAPAFIFGVDPYRYSLVMGIALSAGSLWVLWLRVGWRLGAKAARAAALLFALCPPVWLWTTSGLETPLVLLVQVMLWAAVDRLADEPDARALAPLCVAVALSALARCDGFIVPALAVGYLALIGRRKAAVLAAATLVVVAGAHVAWRYGYYGDLLPNVYYAKVCGPLAQRLAAGARHLGDLLWREGLFAPVAALLASLVPVLRRRSPLRFEHVMLGGLLAYWLYVGGDVFHERFLVVLYPLGAVALLGLLSRRPAVYAAGIALMILALAQEIPLFADARYDWSARKYDRWLTLGEFLRDRHPGETLAIDAAGKVPFVSRMRTIDMLGLNDASLARKTTDFLLVGHNKWDADYVLGRKPDLIAAWTTGDGGMMWGLDRARVERAGYRLAYLVNATAESREPNILDVRACSAGEIRARLAEGYTYGVLARSP